MTSLPVYPRLTRWRAAAIIEPIMRAITAYSKSGRRRSLRLRLLSLVVITMLPLPLLVITAIVARQGARDTEARVTDDRVALARAAALTVSAFIDAQLAAAGALAPTPDVSDPFTRPDLPGFLKRALTFHPDWESVDIFSPQGVNLATTAEESQTVNIADRPYFQEVLSRGQPVVSPATISPQTGEPVVALAIPIRFAIGVGGALVVTLKAGHLNELLREVPRESDVQFVLLDGAGTAFAHSGDGAVRALTSWRGGEEADAALAGETGSRRGVDDNGVDTLVAYAPVPRVGWGVLASQPAAAAFGSVQRQLRSVLAFLGLTAVLTGVVAWYLGRRLSRSYERELGALARAEEASRQRDEFLASASHDLKTPLTTIKALAQLLQRRAAHVSAPDAQRFEEGLATIDAATSKMITQIDDLMDVVRLQTDRPLDLHPRPMDLVGLARKVVAEQQQTTEHHHIRVEAAMPQLIGSWDPARMERVLDNLLGNAVKYSPTGGEIVVGVSHEQTAAGDWAVLVVRDQGVGIPAADLPHVFEPFHRARNVGKVAGTGIGLAGVRRIVEQHGGAITAESREGVGSAFRVRLPLTDEFLDPVAADPPAAPRWSSASR